MIRKLEHDDILRNTYLIYYSIPLALSQVQGRDCIHKKIINTFQII